MPAANKTAKKIYKIRKYQQELLDNRATLAHLYQQKPTPEIKEEAKTLSERQRFLKREIAFMSRKYNVPLFERKANLRLVKHGVSSRQARMQQQLSKLRNIKDKEQQEKLIIDKIYLRNQSTQLNHLNTSFIDKITDCNTKNIEYWSILGEKLIGDAIVGSLAKNIPVAIGEAKLKQLNRLSEQQVVLFFKKLANELHFNQNLREKYHYIKEVVKYLYSGLSRDNRDKALCEFLKYKETKNYQILLDI